MPKYKLGQLKMFVWKDESGRVQPTREHMNEIINVEFDFPETLRSARMVFGLEGGRAVVEAMLYSTVNPNLDYEPGSRPMFNAQTRKYYLGYPDRQPNDPVGELRISWPPGRVERLTRS